jgi:hypothetical protein
MPSIWEENPGSKSKILKLPKGRQLRFILPFFIMIIEEGVFRKKPIFIIRNDERRILFSAGLTKLRLISEHLLEIKDFIARHTTPDAP